MLKKLSLNVIKTQGFSNYGEVKTYKFLFYFHMIKCLSFFMKYISLFFVNLLYRLYI